MRKIITVILGAIIIFAVVVLLTVPVYFLWNWLMPDIFGLPIINFWQAMGINILSSILFGNYYKNIDNKK